MLTDLEYEFEGLPLVVTADGFWCAPCDGFAVIEFDTFDGGWRLKQVRLQVENTRWDARGIKIGVSDSKHVEPSRWALQAAQLSLLNPKLDWKRRIQDKVDEAIAEWRAAPKEFEPEGAEA